MKRFLSCSLIIIKFGLLQAEPKAGALPEAPCFNFIQIFGQSNITGFHLQYESRAPYLISSENLLSVTSDSSDFQKVVLPLDQFIMDNEMMKRDFLHLLKADSYPNLVLEINREELLKLSHDNTTLNIFVSMAGVKKVLPIPCQKTECVNGDLVLTGSKILNLTDFEITPRLYLGLIRISNEIIINFAFSIERKN